MRVVHALRVAHARVVEVGEVGHLAVVAVGEYFGLRVEFGGFARPPCTQCGEEVARKSAIEADEFVAVGFVTCFREALVGACPAVVAARACAKGKV